MARSVRVTDGEIGWQGPVGAAIRELAREVETVDLRTFEGAEPSVEMARLVAWVDELAARATQIMKTVLAHYEEPAEVATDSEPGFPPEEDTSVRKMEAGSIAFVAQMELRQCRERLAMGNELSLVSALNECDRTLRRILRGLMALDDALSLESGSSRVLDDSELLSRSLRVRACYAELRARIHRQAPPDAATITKTLRLIGTTLAVLVGRETYSELRVGDRLQLRALQFRILDWLRARANGASTTEGLQLWSDIMAFLGVLQQVNRRPELQEHDGRVLELARATLRDGGELSHWPSAVLEELRSLRGKSLGIDEVLASADAGLVAPWRALLNQAAEARLTAGWDS